MIGVGLGAEVTGQQSSGGLPLPSGPHRPLPPQPSRGLPEVCLSLQSPSARPLSLWPGPGPPRPRSYTC